MRIYGDNTSTFTFFDQIPRFVYGKDDVLKGTPYLRTVRKRGLFSSAQITMSLVPQIYLHIPKENSLCSRITYFLRKNFLGKHWKTVYLNPENGNRCFLALANIKVKNGALPQSIKETLNKPFLLATLKAANAYAEVDSWEYLTVNDFMPKLNIFKKKWSFKPKTKFDNNTYYHIHRKRGFFSSLTYFLKKNLSSHWIEKTLVINHLSEKILIDLKDHANLVKLSEKGINLY